MQAASPPTPIKRDLTVYDTPAVRSVEDEARDRAKHVDSHPFLHYLGKFIPGLVPLETEEKNEPSFKEPELLGNIGPMSSTLWLTANAPGGPQSSHDDRARDRRLETPTGPSAPLVLPAVALPAVDAETVLLPQIAVLEFPRYVTGQIERFVNRGEVATRLKVLLDPPHLGKLELAFTYFQQKVQVNVVAATPQAKSELDSQLSAIRAILRSHQLTASDIMVVVASGGSGGDGEPQGQNPGFGSPRYRRRRRREPGDELIAGI